MVTVGRLFPETANAFRQSVYRALWLEGLNIGSRAVLEDLLRQHEIPIELLEMCDEAPEDFFFF